MDKVSVVKHTTTTLCYIRALTVEPSDCTQHHGGNTTQGAAYTGLEWLLSHRTALSTMVGMPPRELPTLGWSGWRPPSIRQLAISSDGGLVSLPPCLLPGQIVLERGYYKVTSHSTGALVYMYFIHTALVLES